MLQGEKPLRLKTAASVVGLAPKTLYQLQYTGELNGIAHRFGPRLLYFYESELIAWMNNREYVPLKDAIDQRKASGQYTPRSAKRKTAKTEAQ